MKPKHLVFALALTNAVLYSCVLPLWEGFDEPFHFGYVESVSVWHELPVLHQTVVSSQIRKSLTLVPLSWLLSEAIPGSISFQQWFRLSREEKLRRARELASLSPALRSERSELLNYEAQQAPLAYLALVPVDRSSWLMPLRREIFRLRLFGAILATVLLYISLAALLQKLGLPDCFQMGVLVCVFESQMLWASVAHVGNDWLAVPLALCFLLLLAGSVARNGIASLLALTLIFSAGLLTKAYFLAFAPVFAALIIYKRASGLISWRAIALLGAIPLLVAGPWYARNLIRYGSVSGTQQSAAGIGLGEVWAAIPHIPWLASTVSFARWSLWTGNWSFVSFSRTTLNLELILLCLSFVVYLIFFRHITQAELWMLAACGCFVLGLVYQTCTTWLHTKGASMYPEPWYPQGIIPCLWALCFSGLAAAAVPGRIISILLCLISAWTAEVTYVAKLLPLYGSGTYARSTWQSVWSWWVSNPTQDLQGVVLAPVSTVYWLLVLFSFLLALVTGITVYRLWRGA